MQKLLLNKQCAHQLKIANLILSPLAIALTGKAPMHRKTHHLAIRILAAWAALITIPLSLVALAVKRWKIKRLPIAPTSNIELDKTKRDAPAKKQEALSANPEAKSSFSLEDQVALLQVHDEKLKEPKPGSWREYGAKIGEKNQTLEDYLNSGGSGVADDKRPLHIQLIGSFDEADLKIIDITCEFLKEVHGISVIRLEQTMTMEQLKQKQSLSANPQKNLQKLQDEFPRKDGLYKGNLALNLMFDHLIPTLKNNDLDRPQLIAFTSDDLFSNFPEEIPDFIYGIASLNRGVGIWSNARFGDPKKSQKDFQSVLMRMMKVAAHEFGHMRTIPHCTDYACNMNGSMDLFEVDGQPMIYCAQDAAKIAYLNNISILDYDKRMLKYFESFNERHKLNCDFSKEITSLKQRISVLSKNES